MLTYRVIAQSLTTGLLDRQEWQAATQYYDSSGGDEGLTPTPHPEVTYLPANQVWMLTPDGSPHAWLWDGWACLPIGDRRDLYAAYRSGRSLHELAAELLRPAVGDKQRSAPLPELPRCHEQPIGDWP